MSVNSPQLTTPNPAVERLRYQLLSLGLNTERSDLPSPSKSARGLGPVAVNTVTYAAETLPVSPEHPSINRRVHVPFALTTPANAASMFVGGIGFVAPAPPEAVVRYSPRVIEAVSVNKLAGCDHPSF